MIYIHIPFSYPSSVSGIKAATNLVFFILFSDYQHIYLPQFNNNWCFEFLPQNVLSYSVVMNPAKCIISAPGHKYVANCLFQYVPRY